MADRDPLATQRDHLPKIGADLEAAGFGDPHVIGQGGFGVVYRCRELALDRAVAVKVLTSVDDYGPENLERFLREQHAMARFAGHPNIVQILQVGAIRELPYIVMQYHARGSLEELIRRSGPLPLAEALRIAVKLAGALETVHAAGILHRDIKPGNVLLTDYGEPQLTDFGIARIAGGFQTTSGVVTGSPAFTAPEVLQEGSSSVASDVYGLGATLFCTLTGHAAFERRSGERLVAQFLRITNEPVPDLRPGGIPDDVCDLIEQSMAADPAERPNSAAAFGERIRHLQQGHRLRIDEMPLLDGTADRLAESADASAVTPSSRGAVSRATPPTAETKFRPTMSPRPLVRRERLLDLMNVDPWPRLIVIHAPAGFGKSTLAAQWGQQVASDGVAGCWLNIDADDNNPIWFLLHLIEAIRRARPRMATELGRIIEERGADAERYVLTCLIDEVHANGERIVVIIEDWHRVTAPGTEAALRFLLDNGCHHLQILVTNRERTGLPLSTMQVRNELVEIDSAALRFNQRETGDLLVRNGGLRLNDTDVARLRDRTDGWVAGLQLASISLHQHADPSALIDHMSGRHQAISEYLAENVLGVLEPGLLEHLLETSVSERICGSLASALTGDGHGQALLEDIERHDLFLHRIDAGGEWFRYRHLFADFLRQRLERDHPERVTELHRVASAWFGEHQMLSEAIDHAMAAGTPGRAVELVEENARDLLHHSQPATLTALAAKLPPQHAATHLTLQITLAWAAVLLRHPTELRTALSLVSALEEPKSAPGQASSDLMVEASLIRSVESCFADRVRSLDAQLDAVRSRASSLEPWVLCAASNVGAFDALHRFDFDGVREWHEWGIPHFQYVTGALSIVYSHCLAGMAAREQLDMTRAEDHFRTALRLAHTETGEGSSTARLASAALGDFLYERGELEEADRLLDSRAELGLEGGPVNFLLSMYGTGARVKAVRGDVAAAVERLDEGDQLARTLGLPRLSARIALERIRVGLDPGPARAEGRNPTAPNDGIAILTRELEEESAIRALLRDDPRRAAFRAAKLSRSINAGRRPRAALYATLLHANCLASQGRITDAANLLIPALAQCAEARLIRPVLDEGPSLATVIREIQQTRDPRLSGTGQN